jgi:hypothetical protein
MKKEYVMNLIGKIINKLFALVGLKIVRMIPMDPRIREKHSELIPIFTDACGKDLYEFGVWGGGSMKTIADLYEKHNCVIRKMFGFDSFQGLPEEKDDLHAPWQAGEYNSTKLFKTEDINETIKKVYEIIGSRDFNVVLIPGFWDKMLYDDLVEEHDMKSAGLINIDCDLYTSAYLALDFMFRTKLATKGTYIRYDDWGGTLLTSMEYQSGESRAHREIQEKYNVDFSLVSKIGTPPNVCVIFKVESIGWRN